MRGSVGCPTSYQDLFYGTPLDNGAMIKSIRFTFNFYGYTRLNSQNATDFIRKLELVYLVQNGIHTIQTDNGLEFMGEFDNYLKTKNIRHLFIYPRCSKINAFVERANRTLTEEFIDGDEEYA